MLGNEMFIFCIETLDVYAFQHYNSERDFWNSLISIFPQSLFMLLFLAMLSNVNFMSNCF
jgi:hypothetical protein